MRHHTARDQQQQSLFVLSLQGLRQEESRAAPRSQKRRRTHTAADFIVIRRDEELSRGQDSRRALHGIALLRVLRKDSKRPLHDYFAFDAAAGHGQYGAALWQTSRIFIK